MKTWERIGFLVRSGIDERVWTPQIEGMDEMDTCQSGGINAVKRYVREWLARDGYTDSEIRFRVADDGITVEAVEAR